MYIERLLSVKAVIQKLVLCACLVVFSLKTSAQVVSYQQKAVPDTLTFAERFSISTNSIDWLLLLPNISVEYDIRPEEWNKWAVGAKVRGNWQTKNRNGFKPDQVYNLFEGRVELKNYFRTRLVTPENTKYFPQPKGLLKRLFTNHRDSVVKHPNVTYYRGAYVALSKYSMRLFSSTGRQGSTIQAGIMLGMVRPLYQFPNGNSMDLDLGISAGLCVTRYLEYGYDRVNNSYPLYDNQKHNTYHLLPYPVINEARVAFVYRFGDGSNMITHKYRDRYDVDEAYRTRYQQRIDSILEVEDRAAKEKAVIDALYHQFDSIYNKVHPSLLENYQQIEADKKAAAKAAAAALVQQKKDSVNALALAKKNAKIAEKVRKDSLAAQQKAAKDSIAAHERELRNSAAAAQKAAKDSIAAAQKAAKDSIAAHERDLRNASAAAQKAAKDSIAAAQKAAKDSIAAAKKAAKNKKNKKAEPTTEDTQVAPDNTDEQTPAESSEATKDEESPYTPVEENKTEQTNDNNTDGKEGEE